VNKISLGEHDVHSFLKPDTPWGGLSALPAQFMQAKSGAVANELSAFNSS
jgi:hypothetical protein